MSKDLEYRVELTPPTREGLNLNESYDPRRYSPQKCILRGTRSIRAVYATDATTSDSKEYSKGSPPPIQMLGITIQTEPAPIKYDIRITKDSEPINRVRIFHHPSKGYYFVHNAVAVRLKSGYYMREHRG